MGAGSALLHRCESPGMLAPKLLFFELQRHVFRSSGARKNMHGNRSIDRHALVIGYQCAAFQLWPIASITSPNHGVAVLKCLPPRMRGNSIVRSLPP